MSTEREHFLSSSKRAKERDEKKTTILVGTRDGENILTTVWHAVQE